MERSDSQVKGASHILKALDNAVVYGSGNRANNESWDVSPGI